MLLGTKRKASKMTELKSKLTYYLPSGSSDFRNIFVGFALIILALYGSISIVETISSRAFQARPATDFFEYHDVVPVDPQVGGVARFMSIRTVKSYGRYSSVEKIEYTNSNGNSLNLAEREAQYPISRPDSEQVVLRECSEAVQSLYPTAECIEWTWRDSNGVPIRYQNSGQHIGVFDIEHGASGKSQLVTIVYNVEPASTDD